jgi:hypothetical protein
MLFVIAMAPLSACSGGSKGHDDLSNGGGDMVTVGGDMVTGGGDMVTVGGDMAGAEDFEVFVLNLIQTQTSATSLPTNFVGMTFTDSMDPSKFASLF